MIPFDLADVRKILVRTPDVIARQLTDLPEPWWRNSEGGETWSPFDVVGHLIHGERADWIERARIIIEEPGRTFDPFDRFAQFEESRGETPSDLLTEFRTLRDENIATFDALPLAEHLDRTGTHPDLGTVTLRQHLATWAVSDLTHIAQISRVLLRQYAGEVGPWAKYFSLLSGWRPR